MQPCVLLATKELTNRYTLERLSMINLDSIMVAAPGSNLMWSILVVDSTAEWPFDQSDVKTSQHPPALRFANSLVYYGLSLNTGELFGNPFLILFIAGVVDVPSYIITGILMNRWGRRSLISSLMVLGGIACIAAVYIPSGESGGTSNEDAEDDCFTRQARQRLWLRRSNCIVRLVSAGTRLVRFSRPCPSCPLVRRCGRRLYRYCRRHDWQVLHRGVLRHYLQLHDRAVPHRGAQHGPRRIVHVRAHQRRSHALHHPPGESYTD